jgi:hypothetical protein
MKTSENERVEDFKQWFETTFLLSRSLGSPLLLSESKSQNAKFHRIENVAILLFEDPNRPLEEFRKKIALTFFVNMRTALDYINYAKMIIEEWRQQKA